MRPQLATYFHIHLIADSTGETLAGIMRATCAQFDNILPIEHSYFLVRTDRQLIRVMSEIRDAPGLIFAAMSKEKHRSTLQDFAKDEELPIQWVLDGPIDAMSSYLGQEVDTLEGALLENGPPDHVEFANNLRRFLEVLEGCKGDDEKDIAGSNKVQLPIPTADLEALRDAGHNLLSARSRPVVKTWLSRFVSLLEKVLSSVRSVFDNITDQVAHTRDTPFSQYVTSFAKAAGAVSGYGAVAVVACVLFEGSDLFTRAAMLLSKFLR